MTASSSALPAESRDQPAFFVLMAIAAAIAILHLATDSRYGFHRDELQFLSDAHRLDWGFVVYPPVTPFLARIALSIFGLSLVGLRSFPVLAQVLASLLSGLMARELGGRRLAQGTAALCVAVVPMSLHYGTQLIYSSFDYLWWVLTAYCAIRLLRSENPRWWIAIGASLGIGLMTKYTILGFAAGILIGMLSTPERRYFRSGWFWIGICVALLIVLPNILWQFQHQFLTARCLRAIHLRDLSIGRGEHFFLDQVTICLNPISVPVAFAGLAACLFSPAYRRYRLLAWMYLVPLALLAISRARGYYVAPAYPMLLAVGAVYSERWLTTLRLRWQRIFKIAFFTCLAAAALAAMSAILPIASSGPLREFALAHNWDLRDEVGWEELVRDVAQVRDSIQYRTPDSARNSLPGQPVDATPNVGILAGNYGNADAIDILGPAYHLPSPISGMNSGWLRGYPQPAPTTLIVVGFDWDRANALLTGCRVAGKLIPSDQARNDEFLFRPDIFVCGPPRQPWPEFWKHMRSFG
jgi:4-amino-4-deoxy-L-arabinose transferase-like glycosyltransferase